MEALDLGALLRRMRRAADLSQRQLATRAGVPQVTVSRVESGTVSNPSFRTVEKLVTAAGGRLDADARPVDPIPHEERRDEGDRHYPAHLDVRDVHGPEDWGGAWWAQSYAIPESHWPLRLPGATFDLNRDRRDQRRLRAETRRTAIVRRVYDGVPEAARLWAAQLPDGTVVGVLRALRHADVIALVSVFVPPARRNAGVGRRLMEALLAEAERVGASRIERHHPRRWVRVPPAVRVP